MSSDEKRGYVSSCHKEAGTATPQSEFAWVIERNGMCLGLQCGKMAWVVFTSPFAFRLSREIDGYNLLAAICGISGYLAKQVSGCTVTLHEYVMDEQMRHYAIAGPIDGICDVNGCEKPHTDRIHFQPNEAPQGPGREPLPNGYQWLKMDNWGNIFTPDNGKLVVSEGHYKQLEQWLNDAARELGNCDLDGVAEGIRKLKSASHPVEGKARPSCPKCGASPEIDVSRIQYDKPVQVDCSGCGSSYDCSLLSDFSQFFRPTLPDARDIRQKEVSQWCAAAFGAGHASSVPQRGIRLLEEAVEAYQSATLGLPAEEMRQKAHALVDYVFGRVSGNLAQECGGVGLTLLALCEAAGISAEGEELREIARVKSKPLEHFAKRNQVKNDAGFEISGSLVENGKEGR